MKFLLLFFLIIITIVAGFLGLSYNFPPSVAVFYGKPQPEFWEFRSIDTMKYSRDLSREKINDPEFDAVIDAQMKNIAAAGASHAAIGTPYDEEFLPMLARWISAARKYGLKVWFRGNWSGWEGWFGYPKISPEAHIQKTKNFILANSALFEDGDIFSGCPECENGGTGDPRATGDAEGYRKFLVQEYQASREAFGAIGKEVQSNYFSMNADVARLIMNKETTRSLGGLVTIDHYVATPEKLAADIEEIAAKSGGKVVLGEFGVPIPDIHGEMTEGEQAEWLHKAMDKLTRVKALVGVNYWLSVGGSTAIWSSKGKAKQAVSVIDEFYKPMAAYGLIRDELGDPIANAKVAGPNAETFSGKDGYYKLPYVNGDSSALKVSAWGFKEQAVQAKNGGGQLNITLVKENKNFKFRLFEFLKKIDRP